MPDRWTLSVKGGRRVRIRKGEMYHTSLKDGTEVTFQEQIRSGGEPVHTHVWIKPKDPDVALYLVSYLLREVVYHPHRTVLIALLQGWSLEDEKEDAEVQVELVIHRKLSESLFNFVAWYMEQAMEAVNGYAAMASLFGDNS